MFCIRDKNGAIELSPTEFKNMINIMIVAIQIYYFTFATIKLHLVFQLSSIR